MDITTLAKLVMAVSLIGINSQTREHTDQLDTLL